MSRTLLLFFVALSVVCVFVNAESEYLSDEDQELTGENEALLARVRRAVYGSYKSRSSSKKKHHNHVTSSRMRTNEEGESNFERRTHRERGGSSEVNKKSGQFALGKTENNERRYDQGWGDDDEEW